ncbi:hypothetical protein Efla_003268 [Eimeria flavescens]
MDSRRPQLTEILPSAEHFPAQPSCPGTGPAAHSSLRAVGTILPRAIRHTAVMSLSYKDLVRFVVHHLRGDALLWWLELSESNRSQHLLDDWTDFRDGIPDSLLFNVVLVSVKPHCRVAHTRLQQLRSTDSLPLVESKACIRDDEAEFARVSSSKARLFQQKPQQTQQQSAGSQGRCPICARHVKISSISAASLTRLHVDKLCSADATSPLCDPLSPMGSHLTYCKTDSAVPSSRRGLLQLCINKPEASRGSAAPGYSSGGLVDPSRLSDIQKEPTTLPPPLNHQHAIHLYPDTEPAQPDKFPLSLIDVLIDKMSKSNVSRLDPRNGFYQIRMADKDISKTSFSSPVVLFAWMVMPMGFINAPASFQRVMSELFKDLQFLQV